MNKIYKVFRYRSDDELIHFNAEYFQNKENAKEYYEMLRKKYAYPGWTLPYDVVEFYTIDLADKDPEPLLKY